MALGPGDSISHYRLLDKVGEGGMGVVYRAHDTRLERDVAIKVLPALAGFDEASRRRFRREALALSRLNHPNVATVFDFDVQGQVDFLVMEYIPGTTLDRHLASAPLPDTEEVVRLGRQLADGLEAAHARGILHRDLKPGNLRLTPDGRLKILDFGLAKLLPPAGTPSEITTATATGGVVGTLPYMAPEQLRGEPVDARADIWAMGVILYEMACGRRPFRGETAPALSDAILHHDPVPPRACNERIPPALEGLILKCLERDPGDRYQGMRDVRIDLRRLGASPSRAAGPHRGRGAWIGLALAAGALGLIGAGLLFSRGGVPGWPTGAPPAGRTIESLAVLPFENLTGDPNQQYFVDGMHEALIADLGSVRALRVVSRTSVARYRDTRKSLPEIAEELRVDAVIEGSVFRSDEHVRITAQLIQAAADRQLWASSYEGEMSDILRLQRTAARSIVDEIRVSLTSEERDRLAKSRALDPQAYEAYLRGRQALNQRLIGLDFGIRYFEESLRIDPEFALAHAGLAECYALQAAWGTRNGREAFPQAKAAARRALQIDPALPDAHLFLGYVLINDDLDWPAAEAEYRRALALSPNDEWAHHYMAYFLVTMGRYDEALAEWRIASQLDPFSLNIAAHVGDGYRYARRFDEAADWLERMRAKDGDYGLTRMYLGDTYVSLRRYEDAVAEYGAAVRLAGGTAYTRAALGAALALEGRTSDARTILAELERERASAYVSPFRIALLHLALGDRGRAMDWLDTAWEERSEIIYLRAEPLLDPLRTEPRFQALVRRVGVPGA